ncbi:DEAD/DEAH box helicase [Anaeromyxobacter sp. SG66]|uniref:DEAD/DEAH box helicase n=1 Tax=Anaeromyxobacter sp. SG66 TaxID=2925410 RepID=UPI001F55CF74|nr:DEAD/DEAH box helicase [Anaeromyxobacter sp. SG66]
MSEGDAIEVTIDAPFWRTALGVTLAELLEDWKESGWIDLPPGGDPSPTRLTIRPQASRDASLAGLEQASDEELDRAARNSDVLARLTGAPGGTARVSSTSYIGARSFRFESTWEPSSAQSPSPHVRIRGEAVHPERLWLDEVLAQQPEAGIDGGHAQVALLARLRRAADKLDRYGSAVRLTFDEHLRKLEIVTVDRVSLGWEPRQHEGSRRYGMGAWFTNELGEREELPVTGIDREQPIVRLDRNRVAVVTEDNAEIIRNVRRKALDRTESRAAELIADPLKLIPEGVSTAGIDLSEYGARVAGFVPILRVGRPADVQSSDVLWFLEEEATGPFLRITVRGDDAGATRVLELATPADAARLRDEIVEELRKESPGVIDHGGLKVVPTEALRGVLEAAIEQVAAKRSDARASGGGSARLGVVIDERVALEGETRNDQANEVPWTRLDELLAPGVQLKSHQREGLAWMWRHFREGAPGVLLADEMGLGKTLQVACFLALQKSLWDGNPKPALVVAPVMLLENWSEELARFLRAEGCQPVVTLHGPALRELKRKDGSLDVSAIDPNATVLTNYDTLDRHQVSLLKVDWRAVVLDEAQYIKNPETFRSRAARALKRDFGICSTGTPVENRLLDLWTLFDFLSPVRPLGTQAEFKQRFEVEGRASPKAVADALEHPSEGSLLRRRTKAGVLHDLPPKTYAVHRAAMTDEQMALERVIVQPGAGTERGTLEVLSRLRSLYQHPWLLRPTLFGTDDEAPPELDDILAASPKLKLCLDILDGVRERREKALVFSPWIKMQQLLVYALRLRYGVHARIVNGEANLRRQALRYIAQFSEADGFHVLVLSPLAAGAGLNIVAANHVIHYGRWWNPAKEDQATDRAHRIGQKLPVTVHYPILHHAGDPEGGFDVALHGLVERKRALAQDFLSPDADVSVADVRDVLRQQNENVQ